MGAPAPAGRRGGRRVPSLCWGQFITLRTMLIIGSNHLISQTGWNRCNLSLSLSCWGPNPETAEASVHSAQCCYLRRCR